MTKTHPEAFEGWEPYKGGYWSPKYGGDVWPHMDGWKSAPWMKDGKFTGIVEVFPTLEEAMAFVQESSDGWPPERRDRDDNIPN